MPQCVLKRDDHGSLDVPVRVACVGQTPPPFGGQAVMIEKICQGSYDRVKLFLIRMNFSREMNEIGRVSLAKMFHLLWLIARIYYARIIWRTEILYYPPAGPAKVPVIRDIIVLLSTRWLFKRVIFHFHAGGVSEMKIRSLIGRTLFRLAYYKPDCAVILSHLNPQDGLNLKARRQVVIPYGIEDMRGQGFKKNSSSGPVRLLFAGVLKESKGVMVLLESCRMLKEKGCDFKLQLMGCFESREFESQARAAIEQWNINDRVGFLGVLSGRPKYEAFNNADVFCFPTFFEAETFGVVLLEAMQFSLPVVATRWRGVPSVIEDGENGFLVNPKSAAEFARCLETLIGNRDLREKMGRAGLSLYLSKYNINVFYRNMENMFLSCA